MKKIFLSILLVIFSSSDLLGIHVTSIRKFIHNASFDAWHPTTNQILFTRRDAEGILQLYQVSEDAENPEPGKEMHKLCSTF
jgi:hypothetical protein